MDSIRGQKKKVCYSNDNVKNPNDTDFPDFDFSNLDFREDDPIDELLREQHMSSCRLSINKFELHTEYNSEFTTENQYNTSLEKIGYPTEELSFDTKNTCIEKMEIIHLNSERQYLTKTLNFHNSDLGRLIN